MPTPYWPGSGRVMPCAAQTFTEKLVRNLHQDAGAVAGIGLAAAGAAVIEVDENGERLLDDGVGFAALHVHDKADAARIVFDWQDRRDLAAAVIRYFP